MEYNRDFLGLSQTELAVIIFDEACVIRFVLTVVCFASGAEVAIGQGQAMIG